MQIWQERVIWAIITLLLLTLAVECSQAQTISAGGEVELRYWGTDPNGYQHQMMWQGHIRTTASWFFLEAEIGQVRWGANDAILPNAMFNAETARTYDRRQAVRTGIIVSNANWTVEVGGEYDRRSIHVVWRNKASWRGNTFPHDNSWKNAKARCENPTAAKKVKPQAEGVCPALGYWDGLRPYLFVETGRVHVEVHGPLYRLKTLTLPWPLLRLQMGVDWQKWKNYVNISGGGNRPWRGTVEVNRKITDILSIGAEGGIPQLPEWRDRMAAFISVKMTASI